MTTPAAMTRRDNEVLTNISVTRNQKASVKCAPLTIIAFEEPNAKDKTRSRIVMP